MDADLCSHWRIQNKIIRTANSRNTIETTYKLANRI